MSGDFLDQEPTTGLWEFPRGKPSATVIRPLRWPEGFPTTKEVAHTNLTAEMGMQNGTSRIGRVYIVGAGPGDPDLLTIKARRLLDIADVVVFDKLVSEPILDLIPSGVSRIFAGKVARRHYMPQSEINTLLLGLACSHRCVVRLKGGDPFVFGRGGEEAAHLAEHGVHFEIVPGVTSASGCSAYAGIPLTHRDLAHGVHYVTGHTKDDSLLDLDWPRLADPTTTLVVYMGRTSIGRLGERLIAHGLPADTPAAAVINGTRPDQQTLIATVATLPALLSKLDLVLPTLLIIGRVVALAGRLDWFRLEPADVTRGSMHAD